MKVADGVSGMDGDDAIFLLADGAAVLALDAGCFRTFFDKAGLVNDADGVLAGMFFGDDFLQLVPHSFVIPSLFGEEPLDGSDGLARLQGDGFGIFPGQIGHQALEVNAKIISGACVLDAGFESSEKATQIGSKSANIHRIHYGVLREDKLHERRILQQFQHSGQYQFIAL